MVYINFCSGGDPLCELHPQGGGFVRVRLDAAASEAVCHLLSLESLEVSRALAALYVAGVRDGERAVRGHTA